MDSAQLRAARGMLNITQADVAKRAEVAERTLWLFENDQRQPQAKTLARIQKALQELGIEFIMSDVGRGVFLKHTGIDNPLS